MSKKKNNKSLEKDSLKNQYHSLQINEENLQQGPGGDTHRFGEKSASPLTTQQGTSIADDANSLKIGSPGPTLMEDFILREKIFHFDHERIPERVVHARGFGAHGYFESYKSLNNITRAQPFQKKGEKTPVFVRFSTVAGNKGSSDLARDVRGFAVKFYTQEGNWDLVGNNIPVFFIQDAIKFPDLIHSAKDEPDSGFPQAQTAHDNFWDFISLTPESMHMIMWIMSDRAIPRSFRFMEGFGVHTFRLVNQEGKSTFVKFHWKPKQGLQSVTWDEALKINGADPDYHRRDLWNAIKNGDFPEWELGLQLFDEDFSDKFPFDVLDATKLIPEEDVPIQIVGRLVLDRCVDNFFAETEQVAFCTQNIIPGIDFTDDPLLQARNFSYLDTQLKRLGSPNFTHLPINAPKCPFANFQQDGHMAFHNPKGRVNYNPNSWNEGPQETRAGFASFANQNDGRKLRVRPEKFADHYSQARQFYISQNELEQQHIADALIFELSKVERDEIRVRIVSHLIHIDKMLAKTVSDDLGLEKLPKPAENKKAILNNLKPSPKLSILKNSLSSFKGRQLGVLIDNQASAFLFKYLQTEAKKTGVDLVVIAPHINGVTLNDGTKIKANQKIGGGPSVLYDAVVILLTNVNSLNVLDKSKVEEYIKDAYLHGKFIGYSEENIPLLNKLELQLDKGMVNFNNPDAIPQFLNLCKNIRFWARFN
ncbi:catalase [Legionella sp.]|uniref:catalase n=1 Tax=Legionella sp. TaxID=459 RepID=UPI003C81A753